MTEEAFSVRPRTSSRTRGTLGERLRTLGQTVSVPPFYPGSNHAPKMAGRGLFIYFAASIRAGRGDAGIYSKLVKILKSYGTVLTEHVGSSELGTSGNLLLTFSSIALAIVDCTTTSPASTWPWSVGPYPGRCISYVCVSCTQRPPLPPQVRHTCQTRQSMTETWGG